MENHDILFEKIEAKEREWEEQVKYLRAKSENFDIETRTKFDQQINNLNTKLKEIEKRTSELKKLSKDIQPDLREKIIHIWIESFTKIDSAMIKLRNL